MLVAEDFECNICFELAQDPIVTLCGHLYCWPCLYRWLHHHSNSQECPVCKALIQEEKLVPLYGRGKTQADDPRSRSYPGITDTPPRPAGQRPETAPPPAPDNAFRNFGFGPLGGGGFAPMATGRIGNFMWSGGFGFGGFSLFPSLFNIQFHGFHDAAAYGTAPGFHHGFHNFHGGHANWFAPPRNRQNQTDNALKNLLLLIGFFVLVTVVFGLH
ncbi:unnamed protein product [Linum trigynum]|uniref:E3 ubiquitin-protein ligase RMA n=1 Tax=Linum trigynum TaxID=586398 RepID=A0AAV2GFG3_9ROSI